MDAAGGDLTDAPEEQAAASLELLLALGFLDGSASFVLRFPLGLVYVYPRHPIENAEQRGVAVRNLDSRLSHGIRNPGLGSAEVQKVPPRVRVDRIIARPRAQRPQQPDEIVLGRTEPEAGLGEPMCRHPGASRARSQQHVLDKGNAKGLFRSEQLRQSISLVGDAGSFRVEPFDPSPNPLGCHAGLGSQHPDHQAPHQGRDLPLGRRVGSSHEGLCAGGDAVQHPGN